MTTKHGLSRSLKAFDTFALSFGAMIGWSWVALMATIIARGGTGGGMAATLIVGVVILVIGLIYGELAAAMPDVGGEHVYSLRALGRGGAFVCTWSIVFVYVAVSAFEAVALPTVSKHLFPDLGVIPLWEVSGAAVFLDLAMIGAVASLLLTIMNIRGIKLAAVVQSIVVVIILLSGIVLFTGMGLKGEVANMPPFEVNGITGMLAAMAIVPFIMTGFDVIPQAAEEINLPPKKIAMLIVGSIIGAIAWYILIEMAITMLLSPQGRAGADLATISAAQAAWGRPGAVILLIGGVAGILTSWNSFMVGGSRAIFAMAQDGMLPKVFAKVHGRYHTPVNAIILVGLAGIIAPFLGRQSLVWFVDAGSFALMIAYFMVCWSFIVLRKREPDMERPFKLKYGVFLGWVGGISSVLMASLYLPTMPAALIWPQEWLMVLVWFVGGALMFWSLNRS